MIGGMFLNWGLLEVVETGAAGFLGLTKAQASPNPSQGRFTGSFCRGPLLGGVGVGVAVEVGVGVGVGRLLFMGLLSALIGLTLRASCGGNWAHIMFWGNAMGIGLTWGILLTGVQLSGAKSALTLGTVLVFMGASAAWSRRPWSKTAGLWSLQTRTGRGTASCWGAPRGDIKGPVKEKPLPGKQALALHQAQAYPSSPPTKPKNKTKSSKEEEEKDDASWEQIPTVFEWSEPFRK